MAEQKQEKKKPISVREILRWILCGLLGLLLIAAVTIRAPGKIVALLIVLLLACAALPRRARKWFGLSTAAAVIVLAAWVFVPDGDADWRPYTFEEELAALQAKYAVPDEENAALIYDKLLGDMDGDPNEPEFLLQSSPSSKDEPWLSKDHPETAEWLKGHQSTIEKLLQAAEKDKCQFPIGADAVSYPKYVKRLPQIRRCTFLLLSAGNNDVAEGRTDAGLKKYLCITQIAHHLYEQQEMMCHLAGFAIEDWALTQLNRFVIESQPNGEHLELIANSIKGPENNWGSDFIKVLEYEKLLHKNTFCSLVYQVNPQGEVRLSRDPWAGTRERWEEQLKSGKMPDPEDIAALERMLYPTYWQRKLVKAQTISRWFYTPTLQEFAKSMDASYERYYAMTEPDFDWTREPQELLSVLTKMNLARASFDHKYFAKLTTDMSEQSYYGVHDAYLRNLALRRGSRLLVAIRQYQMEHNAWPADLDAIRPAVPAEALIDPVTANEFAYENQGEYFSLKADSADIWPK